MCFFPLKKKFKKKKISLQTLTRILEATVVKVVKHDSKTWVLWNTEENLLDVFKKNCLRIILGAHLPNHYIKQQAA